MEMEPAHDSDSSTSSIHKISSSHYNTQYITGGVAIKVKEGVDASVKRSGPSEDDISQEEAINPALRMKYRSDSEESLDSSTSKSSTNVNHVEIGQSEELDYEEEEEKPATTAPCIEFADKILFAKQMVESVLEDTQEIVISKKRESQEKADNSDGEGPSFKFFSYESLFSEDDDEFTIYSEKPEFTSWPSIGEFTIALGAYKIDEYLSSFKTDEEWLYVIYYLGFIVDSCSELHKYEAIYSLPTFRYPIAQATASLYFTLEVCRSKPSHCPVDVTFQYESFRFKHKPGASDFKEMWLHYILTSKITFFRSLTF